MQVLIFTSPVCAPCRQLKPILAGLQESHKFKLRVVEASPLTKAEFERFHVRSVPTVIVLNDEDQDVGRFGGLQSPIEVEAFLRRTKVIRP